MTKPSESATFTNDNDLYIILADYSNDLANLQKRDGLFPAQAAIKRIKEYFA